MGRRTPFTNLGSSAPGRDDGCGGRKENDRAKSKARSTGRCIDHTVANTPRVPIIPSAVDFSPGVAPAGRVGVSEWEPPMTADSRSPGPAIPFVASYAPPDAAIAIAL